MPKEPPKERMLDFAPSNRGSCKNCGSKIPEGSCRVTKYVNSPWHDGFSAERYLPACLDPGHGADSLDKIKNLGAVRFKDQVQLLTQIGVKISKNAAKNKTASDAVFALADRMTVRGRPVAAPTPSTHPRPNYTRRRAAAPPHPAQLRGWGARRG
jgi:hypothetical protein